MKSRGGELTLGFAEVQGMVGHGHPGSLPGIDVSSRVVVTLGVLRVSAVLRRCGAEEEGEEGEEEEGREERGARRAGERAHGAVAFVCA